MKKNLYSDFLRERQNRLIYLGHLKRVALLLLKGFVCM